MGMLAIAYKINVFKLIKMKMGVRVLVENTNIRYF